RPSNALTPVPTPSDGFAGIRQAPPRPEPGIPCQKAQQAFPPGTRRKGQGNRASISSPEIGVLWDMPGGPYGRVTDRATAANGKWEVDREKIRQAVRMILEAVGEDPDREGLAETPRRVADMYAEIFSGLGADPAEHLQVVFEEGHDELILVKDIPFYSLCE